MTGVECCQMLFAYMFGAQTFVAQLVEAEHVHSAPFHKKRHAARPTGPSTGISIYCFSFTIFAGWLTTRSSPFGPAAGEGSSKSTSCATSIFMGSSIAQTAAAPCFGPRGPSLQARYYAAPSDVYLVSRALKSNYIVKLDSSASVSLCHLTFEFTHETTAGRNTNQNRYVPPALSHRRFHCSSIDGYASEMPHALSQFADLHPVM